VVTVAGAEDETGPEFGVDLEPHEIEIETEMGQAVTYTDDDRRALVALFAGYLEPFPRHDRRPRSYADAAARLGVLRTTLVKRIESCAPGWSGQGCPTCTASGPRRPWPSMSSPPGSSAPTISPCWTRASSTHEPGTLVDDKALFALEGFPSTGGGEDVAIAVGGNVAGRALVSRIG
jgi:hypothetical protein